jgi:hypothetical protein
MLLPSALLPVVASLLPQQEPEIPRTVAESSGFTATSRAADVQRFCEAVQRLPHGDRVTLRQAGTSHEGRPLLLARIAEPGGPAPALRVLVIGNIHAGETEGKEALQVLLREFASGEHDELLQRIECWFLPIYNVDGNEAVGPGNRPGQNGPDETGVRANALGLDLNRDLVKADAPETRALLALFRELDPHVFVDLHTTNGSYHGYHLTHAGSLSPNVDPGIAELSRRLIDGAQAAMHRQHGFRTFDYGNFETRDWDGGGAPESAPGVRGWYTYDHRARYATNYFGLRNRIAVLSEAYSHCDFATRIAATRAFVLCLLHGLAVLHEDVERACADADRRLEEPGSGAALGFATKFAPPESLEVLVGEVERLDGPGGGMPRFQRKGDGVPERMPVVRAFRATRQRELPFAWAIPQPPPDVVDRLAQHGVRAEPIAEARKVTAQRFAVTKKRKPKRPFQGHQELVLEGEWLEAAVVELQPQTLLIPARQPLGRLAAVLLEPESEDSLSTWNFFEAATGEHYPVLRLAEP